MSTEKEIVITGNNLVDVINWLKEGYIICLHNSYRRSNFFYSKEQLESITNQEIIYIDVVNWPELIKSDEWPYYINEAGFVVYKSTDLLPIKEHHFELP
jgi:hypothetical protein